MPTVSVLSLATNALTLYVLLCCASSLAFGEGSRPTQADAAHHLLSMTHAFVWSPV